MKSEQFFTSHKNSIDKIRNASARTICTVQIVKQLAAEYPLQWNWHSGKSDIAPSLIGVFTYARGC